MLKDVCQSGEISANLVTLVTMTYACDQLCHRALEELMNLLHLARLFVCQHFAISQSIQVMLVWRSSQYYLNHLALKLSRI